jgi:hypothetical protein
MELSPGFGSILKTGLGSRTGNLSLPALLSVVKAALGADQVRLARRARFSTSLTKRWPVALAETADLFRARGPSAGRGSPFSANSQDRYRPIPPDSGLDVR